MDPGVRAPLEASFSPSSRARLTTYDRDRFEGDSLFCAVGRALCEAGCLPRKELYESWEVARRVRRYFRGGRVVDLASGHGLLAHLLLLLDATSEHAVAVDRRRPKSASLVAEALTRAWPRLAGRVSWVEASIGDATIAADDLVVSVHACGALTDDVLKAATDAGARVAVLPCCQDARTCDAAELGGWLDPALAIDVARAMRLRSSGYAIRTLQIPRSITAKNRLLLAHRSTFAPGARLQR